MTKRKRLQKYSFRLAGELHSIAGMFEAVSTSTRPTDELLQSYITAFKQINACCDATTEQLTALFDEGKTA